jgi:Flp pilus assembly pilin Flp
MPPTSRPDAAVGPVGSAGLVGPRPGWARGQGVVEYGLILSLSAMLAVTLLVFFGGTLSVVLKAVGDAIDAAT